MKILTTPFVFCVVASTLMACAAPSQTGAAATASITGSASYRERIALPPAAVFEATLEDVSRADAPADVIARTRLAPAGQPPFRFTIPYDPARVQPGRRYVVRGRVTLDDALMFTTDTAYPVLGADGAKSVDMLLRRASGQAAGTVPDAPLTNTYWKLIRMGATPVVVADNQREPHLILRPAEKRVSGSTGCNSLAGSYTLEADRLSFGRMAGTMMACADAVAEQEKAVLTALAAAQRWRIAGERLELFDAQGQSVAQFESRYLQ
jgi:putative lipoprotein